MSTTNASELNGMATATAPTTNGDNTPATPRNRLRSALTGGTKFQRLYALAGKAERKGFTIKRDTEEGTFALRCDGFPTALTVGAVAKLAENGGKVSGTVAVGAATGRFTGVVLGTTASEMVNEMAAE
jgi:hypothetical protein